MLSDLDRLGWLVFGITILFQGFYTANYLFYELFRSLGLGLYYKYGDWTFLSYPMLFLHIPLAIFFVRQIFLCVKSLQNSFSTAESIRFLQGAKLFSAMAFLICFCLLFVTLSWSGSGYACRNLNGSACVDDFGYVIAGHRLSQADSEIYSFIINSVVLWAFVIFLSSSYIERKISYDRN